MKISARPKFKFTSQNSIENIVNTIENNAKTLDKDVECKVFKTHGLFRIVEAEQHFWSPQLNVSFEENASGTIVRGMYGPHPTVWAIFLFFNVLLGIALFFVSIMGFAKLNLNIQTDILWFLPAIIVALILVYVAAQIGHKLGDPQTKQLHDYFQKAIGSEVPCDC